VQPFACSFKGFRIKRCSCIGDIVRMRSSGCCAMTILKPLRRLNIGPPRGDAAKTEEYLQMVDEAQSLVLAKLERLPS
jgi:hypothetical protein